jgi:hypothetical protein
MIMDTERVLAELRSAVRSEPRFTRWREVRVAVDAGSVVLEGEVDNTRGEETAARPCGGAPGRRGRRRPFVA